MDVYHKLFQNLIKELKELKWQESTIHRITFKNNSGELIDDVGCMITNTAQQTVDPSVIITREQQDQMVDTAAKTFIKDPMVGAVLIKIHLMLRTILDNIPIYQVQEICSTNTTFVDQGRYFTVRWWVSMDDSSSFELGICIPDHYITDREKQRHLEVTKTNTVN